MQVGDSSGDRVPRWVNVLVIASPAIPLLGMGLLKVGSDDESLIALVPFVLIAALAVAVGMAVYGARDRSAQDSSEQYWPKSRVGVWAYVAGLFLLPATLVVGAAVSILNRQWLLAGVLVATTVTPMLMRVTHLATVRRTQGERR